MLEKFCPDEWMPSVLDVDLDKLLERGVESIILDLDNTIVPWDDANVTEAIRAWVTRAKEKGFKVCIASNGLKERVGTISKVLGVPAISKAIKPRKKAFKRALELLDSTPEKTAVIGDQIFTDILGGNRMDFYTILITPMSEKELKTTRFVRKIESTVVKRLHKKGLASAEDVALRKRSE